MAREVLRRRVLDSNAGVDVLSGFLPHIQAAMEEKRKQKTAQQEFLNKLQLVKTQIDQEAAAKEQYASAASARSIAEAEAKAKAEAAAKAQYPSAEDQTKQRILALAGQEGRIPLNPHPTSPSNIAPFSAQENVGNAQAAVSGAKSREMDILSRLMPRSAMAQGPTTPFYMDSQGVVHQAVDEGGQPMTIQGKNRIFQQRITPQEAAGVTGARTTAKIGAETSPSAVAGRANAAATIEASKQAAAPSLEKTTSVISAGSALRSIGQLREVLRDPNILLGRGIPGVPGGRNIERLLDNLKLEIVTARGGKALTPTEIRLVEENFPNRLDAIDAQMRNDPSIIQDKLVELELKANALIGAVPINNLKNQNGTKIGRFVVEEE